jgi:GntR family transcriptional regulator / MocR family aminotransferase
VDLPAHRIRAGLEAALRDSVQTGRLAPGTRLPPSRALAADLGIARNTVADAYGQLVAEGWLTARQGSGTSVAAAAPVTAVPLPKVSPDARPFRFDLRAGSPDLSAFPRAQWLTAARKALTSPCLRPEPRGPDRLLGRRPGGGSWS